MAQSSKPTTAIYCRTKSSASTIPLVATRAITSIVVIEDNFGNSYEMEFELNATSSSEDEEEEETSKSGSTDFDLIELDL